MPLWESFAPELMTDLYELTMAESYFREGLTGEAVFSLFVRAYPAQRSFFVSAGVEHLLEIIPRIRFSSDAIDYLASTEKFSRPFLDYLHTFRFTGTVRAIPEGRLFFTQEPVLEVKAPIIEAQLLETLIINIVQLETLLATKALRCVHAARGRGLVDFAMRRAQGVEAGLKAARTAYIAGFLGTSNVLAGKIYGIPIFGTMAHSYVTSFPCEMDAFFAFARAYPENTLLLIDTYDTLRGAHKAVEVARRLAAEGHSLRGVRLDSGDLVSLSREVRRLFCEAGFPDVKIMASGSLDEFSLEQLLDAGAEIDLFAVGTKFGVSADAPYLDIAYKLVAYEGRPVLKLSTGKKTWVGEKQVFRRYDGEGRMAGDVLCLRDEPPQEGEPLIRSILENGEPMRPPESLTTLRDRLAREWTTLPEPYADIRPSATYPVIMSEPLQRLEEETVRARRRDELGEEG